MDEWVGGLGGFAEVFEDVGNVGDAEDVGKGVDYPDDAGIEPLGGGFPCRLRFELLSNTQ